MRRILVTSDGSRYAPGWLVKEARRGRASAGGSDVAGDGGAEKGDASGGSSAASSAHAGGLSLATCVSRFWSALDMEACELRAAAHLAALEAEHAARFLAAAGIVFIIGAAVGG